MTPVVVLLLLLLLREEAVVVAVDDDDDDPRCCNSSGEAPPAVLDGCTTRGVAVEEELVDAGSPSAPRYRYGGIILINGSPAWKKTFFFNTPILTVKNYRKVHTIQCETDSDSF